MTTVVRHPDDVEFAVIDLETTGFGGEPVEIAIVLLDAAGAVAEEWATLVRPQSSISPMATKVHGLRNDHLGEAPMFGDLLGEIDALLGGRIVVGHEVTFDLAHLAAAYRLAGHSREWSAVCTRRMGCDNDLQTEAAAIGYVPPEGTWHQALADARGTAAIFSAVLAVERRNGRQTLDDISSHHVELQALLGPPLQPRRPRPVPPVAVLTRAQRAGTVVDGLAIVAAAIAQLPPPTLGTGDVNTYVAALWDALADRRLTIDEVRHLTAVAAEHGLTTGQLHEATVECFRRVARAAAADHIISTPEERDLAIVATILGLEDDVAAALLDEAVATARDSKLSDAEPHRGALAPGTRVVITGEIPYTMGGRPLTRASINTLAEHAGLVTKNAVSRNVDLVVLCDPASGSRKAEQARQRGIPIITIEPFLELLGVASD